MEEEPFVADISVLPEGCISDIVSLTSPKDACRLCAVSHIFHAAAESNAVWERFLPSDYQAIIARSSSSSSDILNFSSKKKIYLSLSDNPILIDDSKKSFFLDKSSGKKCYLLAARELCIIWSGSPQYWNWISLPEESRFPEVAELLNVCWLDICGKMSTSMLSPNTNYAAYLVYKLTEGAYGFDRIPPTVSVGTTEEGEVCKQTVFLGQRQQHTSPPSQRKDGWLEIKLGEYFNEEGKDYELQIRLLEGDSRQWKRGLIVEGIEIRPTKG
ncbi:F-box protein At2g02240-like [Quercus lobata]|nr:F-box protein At2g02240-like [Quercus lobata]